MVNDAGQLYTMEGIAAGLIMLLAAYIVVSTTSIHTTGDTHIPDMQLEQLGSDVLAMMDTPDSVDGESQLVKYINNANVADFRKEFKDTFLTYCNATTDSSGDNLHMSAIITYRSGEAINKYELVSDETWTGRENAVRVTRWVHLDKNPDRFEIHHDNRVRAVLVEVLLWRA